MKLFDKANIPNWLEKNRKAHDLAAILLTFVIVPIYSILLIVLTCDSVGLRVVETSISKLAWENGYLIVAYFWGIVNLALYIYLTVLALNSCGFNGPAKEAVLTIVGIAAAFIVIGVSIPFLPADINWVMRFCHNFFATFGFALFAASPVVICIMLCFRDKRQGIFACAFMAFIVITGVYSIPQVNAPSSNAFVTAAAQLYVFMILQVLLAIIYLTQPLFDGYKDGETASAAANAGVSADDQAKIAADTLTPDDCADKDDVFDDPVADEQNNAEDLSDNA